MKRLLTLDIILLTSITFFSCNEDKNTKETIFKHYKKVYEVSISHGDYITAANAIYNEWVVDTANAFSYKDTLANLYYKSSQFIKTVELGKEVIAKKPNDQVMMELVGSADLYLNNPDEALYYYKIIYSNIHSLFHLYKIASIQYNLGSMNECNQSIDQILADTGSLHQKVPIDVGQGITQNVPYSAAALNIRGVIAKGLKQKDVAKKAFNDALAIDPEFALPKSNLDSLSREK